MANVIGTPAKAMLTEIAGGTDDPEALAELAKVCLRHKLKVFEPALTGTVDEHHCFILVKQLEHIDFLDE